MTARPQDRMTTRPKICNLRGEEIPPVLEIDQMSFSAPVEKSFFRPESTLIAKFNSKVVGYLVYEKVLDEVHILRFAVHPNFRRRGIGKSLLEETFKYGKRFFLEVRASNIASKNLCESLNFKVVGIRKSYYQDNDEDALVMAKS